MKTRDKKLQLTDKLVPYNGLLDDQKTDACNDEDDKNKGRMQNGQNKTI